jgi:hypothetical protein
MTDALSRPDPAASDDLQFDNAEYLAPAPTSLTCKACQGIIPNAYYEINGQVICASCAEGIRSHLTGGSGFVRFVRASLFGAAAAFVGFLIYFGVINVTGGLQVGLLSILVGFMVGSAVRKGSRHRGGWVYQLLAVFLTYFAIGASYTAQALPEFLAGADKQEAEGQNPGEKKAGAKGDVAKPKTPAAAKKAEPAGERAKPAKAPRPPDKPLTAQDFVLGLVALTALVIIASLSLPIAVNLQSPIGLFIVGFALWEAWKLNRTVPIVVNGPYDVGHGDGASVTGQPSHV